MINDSFQGIDPKFYDELPQATDQLRPQLSTRLRLDIIIWAVATVFNSIKHCVSKLFELSCKIVGIAITGINLTLAKVENLVTYISQINLNLINLAPQTTVHHHHVHYHACSHDFSWEEGNRQSDGFAY
jgi:hypothetical protein